MQVTVDVASFSDAGPRKANEDAILEKRTSDGKWILAVADGLGGHFGGSEASQMAIECLSQTALEDSSAFREAFIYIHERILERQTIEPRFKGMATTLTAVKIDGLHLLGAHCGDTRCIVQRGVGIRKLTVEHTEAQRLFEAGKISKEEFLLYPRRNILDNALGAQDSLRVDVIDFALEAGDKIIITSDGVHEKLRAREMLNIIIQCKSASESVSSVRAEILRRVPEDNFSIVCGFLP